MDETVGGLIVCETNARSAGKIRWVSHALRRDFETTEILAGANPSARMLPMEENLIGLAGASGRKLMAAVRTARLAVKLCPRVRHVPRCVRARGTPRSRSSRAGSPRRILIAAASRILNKTDKRRSRSSTKGNAIVGARARVPPRH